jgi:NAD(P)-dependent dehydrogenase (short-subunit alcohol dehydrogenase family)
VNRLAGKVALISGGASGIGLAAARRFAAHGASVVIGDIDTKAAALAENEHQAISYARLDVTDDASWSAVLDEVRKRFGRLDVLVNSAGISIVNDIERITDAEWHRVQAVNVDGVFFGCRHGVRAMKARGGSIVNLSSVAGIVGSPELVAYNASKGAVRLLTKSVALHCARKRYGIRCNSVHPGYVETPMVRRATAGLPDPEAALAYILGMTPLGRLARPEEIADLLVYLASDESAYVTGAEFVIDGGLTAQ